MGTTNVNGGKLPQNNKDFRIPNKQGDQQGNGLKIASKFQVGTPPPGGRRWSEMTWPQTFVFLLTIASATIGKSYARSMESGSREGNNVSNEMQPVEEVPPELLEREEGPWNSREFTNVEYLTSKELQFGMVPESQSRETLGSVSQESSESSITPLRYLAEAVEPNKTPWRELSQGKEEIRSGNANQYSDSFQNHLSRSIEAAQRTIYNSQYKALQRIMEMTNSLNPLSGEESTTWLPELASKIKNANNGLADVSEFKKYQTGPHLNTAEGQATAEVDKSQIDISRRFLRIIDLYQQYQGQIAAGDEDPVPKLKTQMQELKGQMANLKQHINEVQQEIHTWKTQSGEDSKQMIKSRKILHRMLNTQLDELKKQLDVVEKKYKAEIHDDLSPHAVKEKLQKETRNVEEQFNRIKKFPYMTKRSPLQQKQDRSLLKDMVNHIINLWA